MIASILSKIGLGLLNNIISRVVSYFSKKEKFDRKEKKIKKQASKVFSKLENKLGAIKTNEEIDSALNALSDFMRLDDKF